MDDLTLALTLVAALGCGLTAGVFFAFSSFVMRGLGQIQPSAAIAAMQAINTSAVRPPFMLALFGTAATCLLVSGLVVGEWDEAYARYLLAGAVIYIVGVIALTVAYHVPRNEALASVEPDSPEAARLWLGYLERWTAWNHLRAAAALTAAAAMTLGLHAG
jgi:uncharacterized membrane protein